MDQISIGYLSWKRHDVFNQTLQSHMSNGLFDIIKPQNRFIFFQELSEEDIRIAKKYECSYLGDSQNIGIFNAFVRLVEKCETEYFIFAENDWVLIENHDITFKILEDCVGLLRNNHCDIIKLRHRKNPGSPLNSRPVDINSNNWIGFSIADFPYKLESLSWLDEPNKFYSGLFGEFYGNFRWYSTNLNQQRWSNNIFIAKTSYLKNVVLPLLKFSQNYSIDKYSGLEYILIMYKRYLGKDPNLDNIINLFDRTRIVGGEGLFTHKDFV